MYVGSMRKSMNKGVGQKSKIPTLVFVQEWKLYVVLFLLSLEAVVFKGVSWLSVQVWVFWSVGCGYRMFKAVGPVCCYKHTVKEPITLVSKHGVAPGIQVSVPNIVLMQLQIQKPFIVWKI